MASIVDKILTPEQQKAVVKAIATAESNTSGEIRVHIDNKCNGDALKTAEKLFKALKMYKTEGRNGVLVYIAVESHKLAIVGDLNIDKVVDNSFWEIQKDVMVDYFKRNDYAGGLITAVLNVGLELKKYFPYDEKGDVNELSNEISHG